jgi:hypothetical protein
MSAVGTSRTSGDVRPESAKRAKADIDQVAVTNPDFMSTRPEVINYLEGINSAFDARACLHGSTNSVRSTSSGQRDSLAHDPFRPDCICRAGASRLAL